MYIIKNKNKHICGGVLTVEDYIDILKLSVLKEKEYNKDKE